MTNNLFDTQEELFQIEPNKVKISDITSPKSYTGLASFHKYWGKKPIECLAFLIESLTNVKDIIVDPFLGSGLIAREALLRNRRFIGIDINPISIELSRLFINPPNPKRYQAEIIKMEQSIRYEIDKTYGLENEQIASHYLWNGDSLEAIWQKNPSGKKRIEYKPKQFDSNQTSNFNNYKSKYIRDLTFFTNSRINASSKLKLSDLFTGRALHNIDLIIQYIESRPKDIQKALLLTLTASVGQMSNMVFAIKRRGKKTNTQKPKIEVGSWVIGYWRPQQHFEINVWNCFNNKCNKLLKALQEVNSIHKYHNASSANKVFQSDANASLILGDARKILKRFPDNSVSLILTDPPHSDRIPYLELSELWNAILGKATKFNDEIVVSNAKERNKNKQNYNNDMTTLFIEAGKKLKKDGIIALLHNARDNESWEYIENITNADNGIRFKGAFPMVYSAGSVVQDNRKGAMKNDFVLIFVKQSHKKIELKNWEIFNKIPGWITNLPNYGR